MGPLAIYEKIIQLKLEHPISNSVKNTMQQIIPGWLSSLCVVLDFREIYSAFLGLLVDGHLLVTMYTDLLLSQWGP